MVLFIPIVVTVLIMCLIIATNFAIAWWKSNHGAVQRQLTKGGDENNVDNAADEEKVDPSMSS
jgi:hypothetical protein